MDRKKGIDHEQAGTDVSKREDERLDITKNPADRPARQRRDLASESDDSD